jgi:hypothetical protein
MKSRAKKETEQTHTHKQETKEENWHHLDQRSPTDGPRENFGGPWRNLDIICNFYVYYTVSLYYYIISNKQQQISH